VGFGRTGGSKFDYGIKRTGAVLTGDCAYDTYSANLVCWTYDALVKTPGADSNTCNADSGGGLHVGSDEHVAGVTSGGQRGDCLKGDRSYDRDVLTYLPWILKVGGGEAANAACGHIPRIDIDKHVRGEELMMTASATQLTRTFEIEPGTAALRVALNGEDDGTGRNDFDLYLVQGQQPDIAQAVCSEDGSRQFGFCEVANPAPGSWTVVIKRKKGEGLFQLVVTRLTEK